MGLTRPRFQQLQESDFKSSCRVATTTNINLTGGAPATVDGVNLQVGDRVLVTAQSTSSQNGIYIVATLGSGNDGTWTRSNDAKNNIDVTSGLSVTVTEGTTNDNTIWKLITNDPITLGSTNLEFQKQEFSGNYSNVNVASFLGSGFGSNTITTTGNITAGTGTFTTLEVQTGVGSNLVPTSNEVYDLGSADNRWRDLFLSGNTIDLGGARIKSDATEGTIALIPSTPAGNTKAIIIGQRGISTVETDEFGDVSAEAISEAANSANTITGNLSATEIKAESYFFANGDPMLSSAAVRVGRRSGGPMSVRMASGATIAVIGRNGTTLVSIDV